MGLPEKIGHGIFIYKIEFGLKKKNLYFQDNLYGRKI